MNPKAQRMIPAISLDVPNEGFDPWFPTSETAGEFRIVRGRETVQTFIIQSAIQVHRCQNIALTHTICPVNEQYRKPLIHTNVILAYRSKSLEVKSLDFNSSKGILLTHELEKMGTYVVKSFVASCLQDSKEEEP